MSEFYTESTIKNSAKEFQPILNEYFTWLQKRPGKGNQHLSESTIYARITTITKFFNDTRLNPENITADLAEEYFSNFNSRGSYSSRFKNFAKFCYKKQYITHKTLTDINELELHNIKNNININDPEKENRYAIPYERWDEIYNQCKNNNILFAIWLCLNFGLRRDEATNIKIQDVDIKGKRLHIRTSKTEKGIRTFPLLPAHIEILKEYLQARDELQIGHDYLIFAKRTQKAVSGSLMYKWFSEIELDFQDNGKTFSRKLTPHTCRRSFLTYVWQKTKNLYAVSRLAGHSSIQITEKYLRLSHDDLFDECNTVMKQAFS